MRRWLVLGVTGLAAFAALPAAAQTPATKHMIAAGHPLAVAAGLAILREGGSAADAAIATQMVLALVEPQSSGLGGGALAVTYTKANGEVLGWDGRETAPAAVGQDLFTGRDGKPMAYQDAAVGGRAVGVPGTVRMLEALHRAQGKLPWDRLFVDAIRLAEDGFPVSPRLAASIAADGDRLRRQPTARAYFFLPDGSPIPAGTILVNKPLAETLRAISLGGADALLRGPIASDIATLVRGDASPGLMTTDDLAAISARSTPAVCGPYRGLRVCGMGPPSAGGIAVAQILGMLDHFDLGAMDPEGVGVAQLLLEAEKLAYADRNKFVADEAFVTVPTHGLIDRAYLATRAKLISLERANPAPTAGEPSFGDEGLAPALLQPEHGTSQIVVIDDDGNAVSMTSTIQDPFGSRLMVHGFMLNDELTDFAFVPEIDGSKVANRVEGGKRPRSSMSPTLVFGKDAQLRIVTGSQGGNRIIGFVVQLLVRMIDFNMTPKNALAAPHIEITANIATELEAGTYAALLAPMLTARGQAVSVTSVDSGQQAIMVTPAGMIGGADPRREGVVAGD